MGIIDEIQREVEREMIAAMRAALEPKPPAPRDPKGNRKQRRAACARARKLRVRP